MAATLTTHTLVSELLVGSSTGGRQRSRDASLLEDQRGAIMLTGLFMACFLIGSLWFVMGIGDTLVFRNKMQEAADSAAFTSAALHAKGMNFIALCNLVMLVGTVFYLVLGIIADVMIALLLACLASVGWWTFGVACVPEAVQEARSYRAWTRYFSAMRQSFKAIHLAQKTAAYAYPALGVVEGYQNGAKYGNDKRTGAVHTVALSPSLIPGVGSVKKEGLPVEVRPFSDLCKKTVSIATSAGIDLITSGKGASGKGLGGMALRIFNDTIGGVLQGRYCNKTHLDFWPVGPGFHRFWGEDGPYVVYQPAKNGNNWMQTWAINIAPTLMDSSESRVGVAARQNLKYTKDEQAMLYVAQAEFYFDCEREWTATTCNFQERALYAIKWRARMRRVELPAIASMGVDAGLAAITSSDTYKDGKKSIIDRIAGGSTGVSRSALTATLGALAGNLEGLVKGKISGAAEGLDPKLEQYGLTPYH